MRYYPNLSKFATVKKTAKHIGTKTGIGTVIAAGLYGAHRIRKASKALDKTIESQHTKSSMADHQRILDRAKTRRKAATKLRKSKRKLRKISAPGSIKSPGYDYKKWR